MNGDVVISIIVPVYNTSKYLKQCLDSILEQTKREIEVIIVDDGSNDGSEHICDEYAIRDERIKVIHKDNGGLVSARKVGLLAASSDIIGFVDSDDWIEPDMYEKLFDNLVDNDTDIAMCGRIEEYENGSKLVFHGLEEGVYDVEMFVDDVLPRMIVNGGFFEWGIFPSYWDKLFRKSLITKYLLAVDDNIMMGEDAAGVYPCIANAEKISILHQCLYHYRQTTSSMVRKKITDIQKERDRFCILYNSTKQHLLNNRYMYDLSEQWRRYVLFLMTPRADILYEGIYNLDYLFPFPEVKRGSKIIIYGAGLWGRRLSNSLIDTGFCDVVAIADKNYDALKKEGLSVVSPEQIGDYIFDYVVVASSFEGTRSAILEDLQKRYPSEKIVGLNKEVIFSEKTMHAFGLD